VYPKGPHLPKRQANRAGDIQGMGSPPLENYFREFRWRVKAKNIRSNIDENIRT
jgi:hypothetical protein